MAKILVVDDEPVVREPIAASLRAAGHEVASAAGGREALLHLRSHVPDLVLLDIRMPETDGIAVLKEIRGGGLSAQVPVLLLSMATERHLILQAASLGVQGYILKSAFSLPELLERIEKLTKQSDAIAALAQSAPSDGGAHDPVSRPPTQTQVATRPAPPAPPDVAQWPRILTRDQVLERLDHVAGGRTIAGVVAQLVAVANSPRADLADVVRVIQSDPILAARVLQLANSASTGSRGRVRSVEEAARNLGVRGIQNMAISVGICGAFPPEERDGFNSMRCWQHSYAVADLLNLLLHETHQEQAGVNHLIGLCHDLGEILLRQHFADEYAGIAEFAMTHGIPVQDVQTVALGIRHPELISRLLARMGLPAGVVQVIREFYERQIKGHEAGASHLVQALALANSAAHGMLLASSAHETVRPITRTEWRQFSSTRAAPVIDARAKRDEFLTATGILARLPASEEQRLISPPIARTGKRIWYVRPEIFVEFDPLAFALSLLAEVTISRELPAGDTWRDIDGMVVVGMRMGSPPAVMGDLRRAAVAAGRNTLPMLLAVAQGAGESEEGVEFCTLPLQLGRLGEWLAAHS